MPIVHLSARATLLVSGAEAEHFLQNLITTDLGALGPQEAKPGALLTPQGKIMFDFLVSRAGENALRLDARAEVLDDLARRLTLYKLRAKVEISKPAQELVHAGWQIDSGASGSESGWLRDSRFPAEAGVMRAYLPEESSDAAEADWHALRIASGVAEAGLDFDLSDAFPHDVLLDETGGVGFRKGCYVGQEVVSRMQHRGTARRRVMIAEAEGALEARAEVKAGPRAIGQLGSASGGRAIAIVRIDRVRGALDAGEAILAGDVPVTLSIPPWAAYRLPDPAGTADDA